MDWNHWCTGLVPMQQHWWPVCRLLNTMVKYLGRKRKVQCIWKTSQSAPVSLIIYTGLKRALFSFQPCTNFTVGEAGLLWAFFFPQQELSTGLVVSGKKVVRLAGGQAGIGGRQVFVSRPQCKSDYTFVCEIWHTLGPYALVVTFGGHIAIAYIASSGLCQNIKKKKIKRNNRNGLDWWQLVLESFYNSKKGLLSRSYNFQDLATTDQK